MSVPDLLIHVVAIERKQRGPDGQGGYLETYQAHLSTMGRINMAGGRDQQIAAQKQVSISNALFLPPATDIRMGDRVSCEGRTYIVRVTDVDAPGYPYSKSLLERIIPGA